MTQLTPDNLRRIRTALYLVLGSALVFAIADFFLSVAPLQLGNVMWRFGALGLSANAAVTPLVLASLLFAVAVVTGDRATTAIIGAFAALSALYLLVAAGAFSLDALQMRARVAPAAHSKFIVASAVAIVKILVECIASAILALSAFRANREARRVAPRNSRAAAPILSARGTAAPVPPATSGGASTTTP